MAIIKALGLAVSIVINGETVPEYDDPDTGLELEHPCTKIVNKYIESEDEIEYSIRCQALPGHRYLPNKEGNALEFCIIIDGNPLWTQFLEHDDWGSRGTSYTVDGAPTGPDWSMHNRFRFSAIRTNDDANTSTTQEDKKQARELGLIRVEVRRCVEVEQPEGLDLDSESESKTSNLSLAEEALKGRAVSLGTTLSPATPVTDETTMTDYFTQLVDDEHPYAIFNFKYRSRDDLRYEQILPRTPSPEAAVGSDDISDEERAQAESTRRPANIRAPRAKRAVSGSAEDRPRKSARRE
ncbi:hypothetical protein GE09DRAFT_1278133 [Coniochaeta sp. 2T2.1]|nr:hypothetical protein GE09DRAFT_1278133 [Coniochaeta sp. 2T2.1]